MSNTYQSNICLAFFTIANKENLNDPTAFDTLASLLTAFPTLDFATLIVYVKDEGDAKIYNKYTKKLGSYGFYCEKVRDYEDAKRKAVDTCETKYLFMLEDNWYFDTDEVQHSIQDLTYWMSTSGLSVLSLNDRDNKKTHKVLMCEIDGKPLCLTNRVGPKPHIVNVARFRQVLLLHSPEEAVMILSELDEVAVYGGYGKVRTVARLRKEKQ